MILGTLRSIGLIPILGHQPANPVLRTYPPRFAKRVTKYYKRFCTQGNGHFPPEADDGVLTSFQILALLQEQTENDLWLDAQLMESFMYLRGSKSLELGELRQVLPSSIPLP
jgi:hypothetical protein